MKILTMAAMIFLAAAPAAADGEVLRLAVTVSPAAELVRSVAGDSARVTVITPRGRSPHDFQPRASDIAAVAACDLYFACGLTVEKRLLSRVPRGKTVCLARADAEEPGQAEGERHHHHSEPHFWLDCARIRDALNVIADELVRIDPANRDFYRANAEREINEYSLIESRISEILADCRGGCFMVYHPAFGDFARAWGLHELAIEKDSREPSARELSRLVRQASELGIRTVFIQPGHNPDTARAVAGRINADVEVLDPLADDLKGNLIRVAEKIAAACRKAPEEKK